VRRRPETPELPEGLVLALAVSDDGEDYTVALQTHNLSEAEVISILETVALGVKAGADEHS
jgi:hypothetical protein